MAAGSACGRALGRALGRFRAEGEWIVRRTHEVAPLSPDPDSGSEDAALAAYTILAVGCLTHHTGSAEA